MDTLPFRTSPVWGEMLCSGGLLLEKDPTVRILLKQVSVPVHPGADLPGWHRSSLFLAIQAALVDRVSELAASHRPMSSEDMLHCLVQRDFSDWGDYVSVGTHFADFQPENRTSLGDELLELRLAVAELPQFRFGGCQCCTDRFRIRREGISECVNRHGDSVGEPGRIVKRIVWRTVSRTLNATASLLRVLSTPRTTACRRTIASNIDYSTAGAIALATHRSRESPSPARSFTTNALVNTKRGRTIPSADLSSTCRHGTRLVQDYPSHGRAAR